MIPFLLKATINEDIRNTILVSLTRGDIVEIFEKTHSCRVGVAFFLRC